MDELKPFATARERRALLNETVIISMYSGRSIYGVIVDAAGKNLCVRDGGGYDWVYVPDIKTIRLWNTRPQSTETNHG